MKQMLAVDVSRQNMTFELVSNTDERINARCVNLVDLCS